MLIYTSNDRARSYYAQRMFSIRLSEQEFAIIDYLRERLGYTHRSEVVKKAILELYRSILSE